MFSGVSMWLLNTLGWKIRVEFPDVGKYVVIVAPHTSNWDFPLGILAAKAIKLKVHWMGKHTLFRWPFAWFFRAIGGIPIHRGRSQHYISQMARLFDESDHLVLALAPEGTRRKLSHWKTGFHYIARAARVPIVMVYLDFGNKQIGSSEPFIATRDIEADFIKIRNFYRHRHGKNPQNESLIQLQKRTP